MAFIYIDQVHIFPFWCFIPKCLFLSPCSSSHSHFHDAPSPSFFPYFSLWLFHSFPFTSFCILPDPLGFVSSLIFLLLSGLFFLLSHTISFFRCISFVSFVEINYMILLLANSTILPTSSQCRLAIFSFLPFSVSALMLMNPVEMIPFETKVPYAIMSVVSQSFI